VFIWWLSTPPVTPPVTMAVSYSGTELIGFTQIGRQLEDQGQFKLDLRYIDQDSLIRYMEQEDAAGTMSWDLLSVDNDTLGVLIQKGLVQKIPDYEPDEMLQRDILFVSLQKKLRDALQEGLPNALQKDLPVGGQDHFVPFRPNVQLVYYNENMLKEVGYTQLPTTWDADTLKQLAHQLASKPALRRMAIQAHPGKAAAVTVFELITSMGGGKPLEERKPLTLKEDDAGAQQAFKLLWDLAPYLERESTNIQFNTANDMLINNEVALVSNWTYGIKVVRENARKTHIRVSPSWLKGGTRVLGGDVLAIPRGALHPELASKLIKLLIAKQTQRALAETLYWAPVRDDVYAELSAQQGTKAQYFQAIREALETAVMRPITPSWGLVQEVLSDALQDVLQQGRTKGPATAADINALLRPYAERLQAIPREYQRCEVGANKTAGDEPCAVGVSTKKSLEELATAFQTTPAILAKVNGRTDWEPVEPENIPTLLVPTGPRS
jgi:trehalose transport system substrate-binding protein